MNETTLSVARRLYRALPLLSVRQVCFRTFARLVRGRRKVVDLDGLCYELELGETIDLCLYLRQFELEVAAALRQETKPGMTVLDVGANVGAHTILLASLVGPTGRVIAFEPTDFGWRKLQRNVSLNRMPWITTVKAALADRELAGQRVDFRASWRTDGGRRDDESVVDFVRLDEWCRHHGVGRIDLIKLDVDGNEYGVFAGSLQTLSHSLPIIVMEAVSPHFA